MKCVDSFLALTIAVLSLGAADTQSGVSDETAPLSLSISAGKSSYVVGEPIAVTAALHNRSNRSITIVHPDYWGVTELKVYDGAGQPVPPESFKGQRKSVANLMTIPPGETRTYLFSSLSAWTCCYGYTFALRQPGRYQVTLSMTNPPVKVQPPPSWRPDWSGTISSARLAIEVRQKP